MKRESESERAEQWGRRREGGREAARYREKGERERQRQRDRDTETQRHREKGKYDMTEHDMHSCLRPGTPTARRARMAAQEAPSPAGELTMTDSKRQRPPKHEL